jgi:hypothetical protein
MRHARQPQLRRRRVLMLLLVLALGVGCANSGDDDAPEAPPPAGFEQAPLEVPPPDVPTNPFAPRCCRLCVRGVACGDVCLDPQVARCAVPPPQGCACQI